MTFTVDTLINISPSILTIAVLVFLLHRVGKYDVPYRGSMMSLFFFMACITTVWLLERFASDLSTALFLVSIEYAVLGALMVSNLAFVVQYLGMFSLVNRRNIMIASLLGVVVFILNITNPIHHLHYTSEIILESGGLYYMRAEYGPVIYLHLMNVIALTGLSLLLLLRAVIESPPSMKKGPAILMTSILVMLVGAAIYLASPRDDPLVDVFSLSIAVSALIMLYGERKFIFTGHEPIRIQDAIESINDSFLILNMSMDPIYMNESAASLIKSNPRLIESLGVDLNREEGWMDCSIDVKGNKLWFDVKYTVLKRGNRRIGVSILIHDISSRKKTEHDLRMSKERNQTLSRIIEHDIRNDLTAIIGYLDLADSSGCDDKNLLKVQERADNIQNHLEFASEYRHIGEERAEFQSLRQVVIRSMTGLDLCDINMEIDLDDIEVLADPMLPKVFYNLLDNTLRHGEGSSLVRISARPEQGGCIIRYQDNGRGIDPEMKERMFDATARGGRQHGMILIKEMLQITGIDIKEDGTDGASFTMTVPPGHWRIGEGDDEF